MSSTDAATLALEPERPAAVAALGGAIRRNMAWMLATAAWSRVASFAAQVYLGRLLSPEDYGIYAVAMSFGVLAMFIRDGGGYQILIQRGSAEYRRLAPSVSWLAVMFSTAAALLMIAASPLVARAYGNSIYIPMMVLIGISIPLQTPASILNAKLWMDLRARPYCIVQMISALIRYGGPMLLAGLGFGPLSWAWPLIAVGLFETLGLQIAARDISWLKRPDPSLWPGMLRTGKWVMLLALATATLTQGPYLVAGKVATAGATGVFFFAFQIVIQVEALIALNLQAVLLPVMVRLNSEPRRQGAAILRATRALAFLAAPAGAMIALLIDPLEQALWQGKWHAAVVPVQIMALLMCGRIVYVVPSAALQARGRFKRLSLMLALVGLLSMVATAIGSRGSDPTRMSAWAAVSLALGCTIFAAESLRLLGVRVGAFLRAALPTWFIAVLAAAVVWSADRAWLARLPLLDRGVAIGLLYCLFYWIASRTVLRREMEEAMHVLPGRIRGPVSRLLRIRPADTQPEIA